MALGANKAALLGAAGSSTTSGYTIDQSIRFPRTNNTTGGGYMSRTFGSAGNRTSWTWSCWFKLGSLNGFTAASGLYYQFFACDNATNDANRGSFHIIADSGVASAIAFQFQAHSTSFIRTNRQFRDPSAWMHLVLVWDSDNAVASERVRLYINGQRETSFAASSNPTSGQEIGINLNATHRLGISYNISGGSVNYPFDGYMADIHFLDGYSYGPEYFGETNSSGLWIPKEYSGSYGSNGFKIDGRDSSDLGDDESGNGNDFSTSGLGAHDQVLDSPTNNFCTINAVYTDNSSQVSFDAGTLSNGNLVYVGSNNTFSVKGFTFNLPKSGKWYFEYMIGGTSDGFGFVKQGEQGSINASNGPGQLSVAQGGGIQYSGWRNGGNFTVNFGTTFTAGHIHQVAIDVDNGKFFYGVQNTYYAADAGTDGNPSAGTNETSTFAFSTTDVVLLAGNYTGTQYWNFGQDGTFAGQQTAQGNSDANGVGNFFYAPPTGYKALCTKNLGS